MLKASFGSGVLGLTSGGDFSWTGTPQTLTWSHSNVTMMVSVLVNIHEKVYSPPCFRDGLLVQTMFCMPIWHQASLQDAPPSPTLPPKLTLPRSQLRTYSELL